MSKRRGNPHFMNGVKARRLKLLRQLRESTPDRWDRVIARFAISEDLRMEKVREYFKLLQKAGYLEKNDDGSYDPVE